MAPSNPFDFSDFGPAKRPSGPPPSPGPAHPGAPAQPPSGPPDGGGPSSGFDPWAGQSQTRPAPGPTDAFGGSSGSDAFGQASGQDAFGGSVTPLGVALTTAGPPLVWFVVALGLAVAGAVIALVGALAGGMIATALAGWLLAGPVAIGALAVYNRVDTRRRTESIYSAPSWTATLYWVVLAACLVGIALGAWQIALWAGRL
jgi:hypothetical protein